jgi:hypothetical protein
MRDALHGLARVRCHHLLQACIDANDLARLNLDIRGCSLKTCRSLVNQDAGTRQR